MLSDRVTARAMESADKLLVKSALNPVLWLCAIICIPSIIAAYFIYPPPWCLIFMIIFPATTALFGFLFLLFFDRDKLQSEEFQLKKRSLEMIQEKGENEILIANPNEVEDIENPDIISIDNQQS